MGTLEVHTGFSVRNRRGRDYLVDPLVDGSVILSRMFRKWDGEHGMD